MLKKILVALLLAGTARAQSSNGIFVDKAKVYDDYYLQSQLDGLKARLAAINAADQATLLGKVGGLQGSTLQQSGFAVQGLGPATPTVTTSLPPAGVAPSSTNGVTTATTPLTPAAPTPPAPTLTVPSTFSPSSLDTLNEEMQLSAQIINLQLLLDGALNDRFTNARFPKRHVTLGFSISVEVPESKKKELANSLAEVEVTLKNPPELQRLLALTPEKLPSGEGPSVMTLLPKEKTYNVASLVDKSVSLGAGGVIAGVFNVGAGWLWGKKTYYLVQQQDTIAMQRSATGPTSDFAWQFRPVLGHKFVTDGTRQTFVQFSVPVLNEWWNCSAALHVRTGWRRVDPKTGLASPLTNVEEMDLPPVPYFDDMTTPDIVDVSDIGSGLLTVSASTVHFFMTGTHFRIGGTSVDQSFPGFSFLPTKMSFTAPAKDIAALGVTLVSRSGKEAPLMNAMQPWPILLCGAEEHGPAPKPSPDATAPPTPPKFSAAVTAAPFSDKQSLVTINLSNLPTDLTDLTKGSATNPVVVVIGDQIFGLRNAPFRGTTSNSVTLLVATDLLKTNRKLKVGQLLWGDNYVATAQLAPDAYPSTDFSISGASIVALADPQIIAITGSGLKGTALSVPKEDPQCMTVDSSTDTLIYLRIQKACADKFKQIVLANGGNPPALLTVPTAKSEAAAAKPSLKPQDAIALNTSKITITGTGLDQISAIRFGKTRLSFTLSLKKDSVLVLLTPDITASEGVQYLNVTFADGTKSRYELNVKKPS